MTDQNEAPQLFEAEEGRGEARQPQLLAVERLGVMGEHGLQLQLLEAPSELHEGRNAGLENVGFDARDAPDDRRAQPAGGDDGVAQRLPERLLIEVAGVKVDQNFG